MIVLDTWAWVEYFHGSKEGAQVRAHVEKGEAATCLLSLAELSDWHERSGRGGLDERIAFIASRGAVLDVSRSAAMRAGRTKSAQRRQGRTMGLGDAIIYEVARENGLELLTGDEGFEGLEGVRFLGDSHPEGHRRAL